MNNRITLTQNNPEPVLVIGSLAYDHIMTPVADSGRIAGGSANYAALALSQFAPGRVVGVVGSDYEQELVELLETRGMDTAGIERDLSGKTFFWRGRYHENFNRRDTLVTELNVFEHFNPKIPEAYRKSKYVMLGAIHPALQHSVLDQLEDKEKGAFVLADTFQLWIDVAREELLRLFSRVSMISINDAEAELLTGQDNIFKAGYALQKKTPIVLIKKGEHGAVLFHEKGLFMLPAYPVLEMQDPTGAGDSFAGAFIGALSAQGGADFDALRQAMVYAAAVGSLTVQAFGFNRLIADDISHEIKKRAQALRELTQF